MDGWTSGAGEDEDGPVVYPKVDEEEPPIPKCWRCCCALSLASEAADNVTDRVESKLVP